MLLGKFLDKNDFMTISLAIQEIQLHAELLLYAPDFKRCIVNPEPLILSVLCVQIFYSYNVWRPIAVILVNYEAQILRGGGCVGV